MLVRVGGFVVPGVAVPVGWTVSSLRVALARGAGSVLVCVALRPDVGVATIIHGVWVGDTSVMLPSRGVAVTAMIHGVWVGRASATLSGPGVAVTTMIQGVCVGGAAVGSGSRCR